MSMPIGSGPPSSMGMGGQPGAGGGPPGGMGMSMGMSGERECHEL